tara:strand:+ start:5562 stop:5693 length:132 start_codon:yes stop_codon:yes gene_type:complete
MEFAAITAPKTFNSSALTVTLSKLLTVAETKVKFFKARVALLT